MNIGCIEYGLEFDESDKPGDWPANDREALLSAIREALLRYVANPGFRTKEVVLTLVNDYDLNRWFSRGVMRITPYEVRLINRLYLMAMEMNFNSVKSFLYAVVGRVSRMQRMTAKMMASDWHTMGRTWDKRVVAYANLQPSLFLYNVSYFRYRELREEESMCECVLQSVRIALVHARNEAARERVVCSFVSMMNDLSYLRGVKADGVIRFSREEFKRLFSYEVELTHGVGQDPLKSPLKGVLMTQVSNYVLKSRFDYNDNHVLKYVSEDVSRQSVLNEEIWMRRLEDLNDKHERKVVEGLIVNAQALGYGWAHDLDVSPTRLYYVSSFSRASISTVMQERYGACAYGFKGDRLTELLAPIEMRTSYIRNRDGSDRILPCLSQVVVMDIIYDKGILKEELHYLCSLVNELKVDDDGKRAFLEEILQYWILSAKESNPWEEEQERRYVLFLNENCFDRYLECVVDESKRLRMKTSAFLFPDYVLGDVPVRETLRCRADEKRRFAAENDYLFCHSCLNRDFDIMPWKGETCPVCGSHDVELVKSRFTLMQEKECP